MWATVMNNLRVVNAYVQGNSGVSYEVGYLAQTMLKRAADTVCGGIDRQSLSFE
jgi:hypothetical protein